MRRFRFRLEGILHLREYTERQTELELGRITGVCVELEAQIAARYAERRRALTTIPPEDAADVRARLSVEGYAARLVWEAQRLEERLAQAESERQAALEAFTEARRKADVLRKLRQRRLESYMHDQRRNEQKRLDEVSQIMYIRSAERELSDHAGTL